MTAATITATVRPAADAAHDRTADARTAAHAATSWEQLRPALRTLTAIHHDTPLRVVLQRATDADSAGWTHRVATTFPGCTLATPQLVTDLVAGWLAPDATASPLPASLRVDGPCDVTVEVEPRYSDWGPYASHEERDTVEFDELSFCLGQLNAHIADRDVVAVPHVLGVRGVPPAHVLVAVMPWPAEGALRAPRIGGKACAISTDGDLVVTVPEWAAEPFDQAGPLIADLLAPTARGIIAGSAALDLADRLLIACRGHERALDALRYADACGHQGASAAIDALTRRARGAQPVTRAASADALRGLLGARV